MMPSTLGERSLKMTFLTFLAVTGCLTTLALGGMTLLAERGYSFDLRTHRGRRDARRSGGRRRGDTTMRISA